MRSRTYILVQAVRGLVYNHSLKPSKQQDYPLQQTFFWVMENTAFHVELVIFPVPPFCHDFLVYLITEEIKEQRSLSLGVPSAP